MNLSKILLQDLTKLISNNEELFKDFKHIFLFGSIIKEKLYPHDIDVLLVSSIYSNIIAYKAKTISNYLEKEMKIPVDLTVLSQNELESTGFLNRIKVYYELK